MTQIKLIFSSRIPVWLGQDSSVFAFRVLKGRRAAAGAMPRSTNGLLCGNPLAGSLCEDRFGR